MRIASSLDNFISGPARIPLQAKKGERNEMLQLPSKEVLPLIQGGMAAQAAEASTA
jgi:hypothetical protein